MPFELLTEVPWNDDNNLPLYNPLGKLPAPLRQALRSIAAEQAVVYGDVRYPPGDQVRPDPAGIAGHGLVLGAAAPWSCWWNVG